MMIPYGMGGGETSVVQSYLKCVEMAKGLGYTLVLKEYGPPVPKFQHQEIDAPEFAALQNHPALRHTTFVLKDEKGGEVCEAQSLTEVGGILVGIKAGVELMRRRDEFLKQHGGK